MLLVEAPEPVDLILVTMEALEAVVVLEVLLVKTARVELVIHHRLARLKEIPVV
jgi:hypothetical protein